VTLAAAPDLEPGGDLRAALALVQAAADGAGVRDRILAFADDHPDALLRSCLDGHLTGSAVLVDATGTRAALLLHAKVGRWLQPGGHADGEGNLALVALTEATEETGIAGLRVVLPAVDLDVHRFVRADGREPDHWHLDVRFLVLAPPGAVLRGNEESLDLAWFSGSDVEALDTDASTRRLVRVGLAAAVAYTS
jgi:8-oxo-dGTP pyrophosphatase MutT (NUDIX family)